MLDGNKVVESLDIRELQTLLVNKNLTEMQRAYVQQVLTYKEGELVRSGKTQNEIEVLKKKKDSLEKEKREIEFEIEHKQLIIWKDYVHTLSEEELERELVFVKSVYGVGSYRCCYIEKLQSGELLLERSTMKGDFSDHVSHVDMYQDDYFKEKEAEKQKLEKITDESFS